MIQYLYRGACTLIGAVLLVATTESASPPPQLSPNSIDKIVVYKSKRQLQLCNQDRVIKTYRVALGKNPTGHKEKRGDNKTPEGTYRITAKNTASKFHKSLRISYPNQDDILCAKKNCLDPGGDIMIHGLGKKYAWVGKMHANRDWTQGCIAVSNDEMDEIFSATQVGAEINIYA